jgi:glycosyltransferase involved in cell wall biosynthesis
LRLLVHDYVGHPFQMQLSRWLAAQGHVVLHCYSADFETPRGEVTARADDPASLTIEALTLGRSLPKYQPIRRWRQERRYSARIAARLRAFAPDVVISANCAPAIQAVLLRATRDIGAVFINWLQDFYWPVAARVLPRMLPGLGTIAAALMRRQEFRVLARSDAVVVITSDFVPLCVAGGVAVERISLQPNWAPLDGMPLRPRDNPWARRHGLVDKRVVLYAGTLGLKHNPALLSRLAEELRSCPDNVVVVVTQGLGRAALERDKAERGLDNLLLLDYQDYADLPAMLACAAMVVVLLEPHAGVMSVPSKVLFYLCAGRAILGAIPAENFAARTILEAGAGVVVPPADEAAFVAAARALLDAPDQCRAHGLGGRRYAERSFDIDAIGARFLGVIDGCRR